MPSQPSGPTTIAHVCHGYLHVGGVETYLLSLMGLAPPGQFRWLVAAPASPEFVAKLARLGARWVAWQPQPGQYLDNFRELARLLRAEAIDVVHAHSPLAALVGGVMARLRRLPLVVTVHLPLVDYAAGAGWRARLKRQFYAGVEGLIHRVLAQQVIYVSESEYEKAQRRHPAPPGRNRLIRNGIDLEPWLVRADSNSPGRPDASAEHILCSVSRLAPQKGVDVLIEALRLVPASAKRWRLWLVGDGPERARLEGLAGQYGLADRIEFVGFQEPAADWLAQADIFVLASRAETRSMAVMEAMAAGCACIVTDVGDNARLVGGGEAGLVVPPEDPAALARALGLLLTQADLRARLRQAAQRRAASFDRRAMVAEVVHVYEDQRQRRPAAGAASR